MKIFISWSGSKSQEVAKILKSWIPLVIQHDVEPYFSSADIDKGARWSTDIAKELQNASFGILCVTKDNLSSSWLNFEAGALSKSIDQSRVCPFLVDLKPSDIKNSPILQFQMTNATKDDIFKLFKSINCNLGDARRSDDVLSKTFDTFWPQIDDALKSVDSTARFVDKSTAAEASQTPIEEILELIRYQHKLLKSPSELLPPDYLMSIFQATEKVFPKNQISAIDALIHRILIQSQDAIDNCSRGKEPSTFIQQLSEISESARKIRMLIRQI